MKKSQRSEAGFTLIELMITVAIIAILAAIAIPSYRDYVIRGQLVNATTALSGARAKMEQYYQDNRTYVTVGSYNPPCATAFTAGNFSVSCTTATGGTAPAAATYIIGAKGISGAVTGFTYTVDQNNAQKTTAAPTGWSTSTACWLVKKGSTC